MEKNMKDTIVLYPSPFIGHIVSMIEFAKLIILHHSHRFSITVILTTGSFESPAVNSYVDHISQTIPSINFHRFPPLSNPLSLQPSPTRHPVAMLFDFIRLNNPNLLNTLQTISLNSSIVAIIIDFFCHGAFDVATNLNIPLYYFSPSGASSIATMLHIPTLHNQTDQSFKDLGNTPIHIPGLPTVPASQMPMSLLNRNNGAYNELLEMAIHIPKSRGIISNTFDALEARAIKAIAKGDCTPSVVPPMVFYIGPLIAEPRDKSVGLDCLSWLDGQPSRSVVFLCFGSWGKFSLKQTQEIALGLERSGQRFLWVVKSPPPIDGSLVPLANSDEFDLEAVLPDGFLDRTRDKGLVVKSWAPQVEVLKQHLNKLVLVEEMKLATPMEAAEEDGFVGADEVEKRVRALMDSEEGREIRERCWEMREKALAAWAEDGSSQTALTDLADSWTI
ncbi:hypothetical protein NE237_004592 [Protea cynaroides]|uniref:Uncharacterized protein n=1 Tax=Protea cynaroides TaxID=273540 RepID=A0A9Q0KIW9_9MAGN|nr:hypothetical protein NE237_004592 [Protea cynaroides]